MNSTITMKYQTTVPKAVRDALGIAINDVIEWTVEKGRAVVRPVSFVTSRNGDQQRQVTPFFEETAKSRCRIICPGNVLAEFAYVMNRIYTVPLAEIAAIIKSFIALPGVTVVGDISYDHFFRMWPGVITEYGDAVVAVMAKSVKGSAVAKFDRKMAAALERLNVPLYAWK